MSIPASDVRWGYFLCGGEVRLLRGSEVLRGSETQLWLYKVGAATDYRATHKHKKIPVSDETGIHYIIRLGITQRGLIRHPQA